MIAGRRAPLIVILASTLAACGGSSEDSVDPLIEDFELEPGTVQEIENAANAGDSAEGSYAYDESTGRLTLTLTVSSFTCGIEEGTLVAIVEALSSTTMAWTFEDDGGQVTWTRVDAGGTGITGVWHTEDPSLYLILHPDGRAQIFGEGPICDDERDRNGDSCYRVDPSTALIAIDGDLSDWEPVSEEATLRDDADDYTGADPGADLRALKVAYTPGTLYVLTQLYSAPSTDFEGREPPRSSAYRLTVRGANGLSLVDRLYYDPALSEWTTANAAGGGAITPAVGSDGIEWRIDVSSQVGEGFTSVDLILFEPVDCANGCEPLDTMGCAFFDVP